MYKPVKPVANIIIGAGPAGIQLGYFFQKAGLDYVILERNEIAGSFFDRYPLSGQLISINKPFTGVDDPEFNLRHDWNSLLSDDGPKFTDYSKEYYPDRKDLVRYINDYAEKYKLNIKYKTNVDRISKMGENGYAIAVTDSTGKWLYRCNALIVATGLGVPARNGIRDESVVKVKHYAEYEKDYFKKPENLKKFENKSVLILGTGNAGFELGNLLTPYCSRINVHGKSAKKWAMVSHYAGDLRSIYLPYYDTFLLKSLNAFEQCSGKPTIIIRQTDKDSKYRVLSEDFDGTKYRNGTLDFDHVILCTGWMFDSSIFDFDLAILPNGKYPIIGQNYQSVNNSKLFFIGSLMHSNDYKQSSGGFIHGFRYLIEYFFHLNYDGKFDTSNFTSKNLNSLVNHMVYRINYSSSIYQMYGQMVDVFIYNTKTKVIHYINSVHYTFLRSPSTNMDLVYFTLSLEYSKKIENDKISQLGVRTTAIGTESEAILLHPIIRVMKDVEGLNKALVDEIHFDEDIFADFTDKIRYADKITRTLKMFIN